MNLILWLALGAAVGWLAGLLTRADPQQGVVLNVVVGIAGAFLAGWFVAPLIGIGAINQIHFSAPAVIVALVGAVILLAIVNVFIRAGDADPSAGRPKQRPLEPSSRRNPR